MVIASIEWERVMTTNNHEMTETELEQVTGGKPSAAPKLETMKGPAESGQICSVGRRKNSEENSEK